jgi:hypothetical protein
MDRMEAKRAKRLEKKKRKIEAFLSIAQLNDVDNKKRKTEDISDNTESKNDITFNGNYLFFQSNRLLLKNSFEGIIEYFDR